MYPSIHSSKAFKCGVNLLKFELRFRDLHSEPHPLLRWSYLSPGAIEL